MRRQITKRYTPEVYEQACEWFVEFRSAPADEQLRQDFHAWLQQAPAHMAAYLDIASSWNLTAALDVSARFPKDELIAQARQTDNLLPYPRATSPCAAMPRRRGGRRRLSSTVLAVCAAAMVAAVLGTAWMHARPVYSTGIGQKRLVRLADGSTVRLNARSEIIVRYTKSRREIDLIRGQALFADTYEPNRPFIVRSRATVVRAIGTQFDVNRLRAETIVTVIQGRVAVAQHERAARAAAGGPQQSSERFASELSMVYLSAGEQVTVTPTRHMQPIHTDVTNAIAWTHRKLIFVSTPLRDVVQEFNRYNRRPLVIEAPSLERLKIDGVFSSTDPKSLIAFLRQYPGIRVTQTGEATLVLRR